MKYLFIILIIPFSLFSQNWNLVNPLRNGLDVIDVEAVNEDTYYLLLRANSSRILKTTDHGITWHYAYTNYLNLARDIYMFDDNKGLISFNWGIYSTNNGFQTISLVQGVSFIIEKFYFVNNLVGFAVGNSGNIVKTIDGGLTWVSQDSTLGFGNDFSSVYFVNEDVGYVCSNKGDVLKTIDGGNTWVVQSVSTASLNDIFFFDLMKGVAIGGSQIKYTTDGGITWSNSNYQNSRFLHEIHYINGKLIVCGNSGIVLKSSDFGVNWSEEILDRWKDNLTMGFFGSNAIMAGESISYTSTDYGENWVVNKRGTLRSNFKAIDFANNLNGVIVGDGSSPYAIHAIYTTTDGGLNWIKTKSHYSNSYGAQDIHLLPDGNGIISLYHQNKIYYLTSDYGMTWQSRNTVGRKGTNACWMRNSNAYTLAGSDIYNTTDDGFNWQFFDSQNIQDLYFPSDNVGYAVGSKIYKTTDGGISWVEKNSPAINFSQVQFLTDDIGYVFSKNSGLFKTLDGGSSWVSISEINRSTKFLFLSPLSGINLGTKIKYTNDGGDSWTDIPGPGGFNVDAHIMDGKIIAISGANIFMQSIPSFSTLFPTLGIHENLKFNVKIYPNPTNGVVTVSNKELIPLRNIRLFDFNGQTVLSKQIPNVNEEFQLDLSYLANGVYFLKLYSDKTIITKKIIKMDNN